MLNVRGSLSLLLSLNILSSSALSTTNQPNSETHNEVSRLYPDVHIDNYGSTGYGHNSFNEINYSDLFNEMRAKQKHSYTKIAAVIGVFTTLGLYGAHLQATGQDSIAPLATRDKTIPTTLFARNAKDGRLLDVLDNPLYKDLKKSHFDFKPFEDELEQVDLSRRDIDFDEPLKVSWNQVKDLQDHDILAMYCPASEPNPRNFVDALRIDQASVSSKSIHNSDLGVSVTADKSWTIHNFPIVREHNCQFRIWRQNQVQSKRLNHKNSYQLHAQSEALTLNNAMDRPTGIHLEYENNAETMLVHFTTGLNGHAFVRYGKSPDDLSMLSKGKGYTYNQGDLCAAPANIKEPGKYIAPGYFNTLRMTDLEANQIYYYQVGFSEQEKQSSDQDHIKWSEVNSFQSGLAAGSNNKHVYLVYADQGSPGSDDSDKSLLLSEHIEKLASKQKIRQVHHIGDLSYANGSGHIWDSWSQMVAKFATKVPLMVAIGNHEFSKEGDSNGECGVPVKHRFKMLSSQGQDKYWYSYSHGLVHTIVISSEHSLKKGSEQWKWLKQELSEVDRTLTPWLVVESHRPIYNPQNHPSNTKIQNLMRKHIEPLLQEARVDLFLSGHYHSYFRSCTRLYKGKCDNDGMTHITVGSAGASLDQDKLLEEEWSNVFKREWGYGKITVIDSHNLMWEFVLTRNGVVHDRLILSK